MSVRDRHFYINYLYTTSYVDSLAPCFAKISPEIVSTMPVMVGNETTKIKYILFLSQSAL